MNHKVQALLLYLPTLLWFNEKYYLLLPLFILLFDFKAVKANFQTIFSGKKGKQIVFVFILFFAGAVLNKIFFGLPMVCLKDYYAWFLLFPLLIFVGLRLKDLHFSKTLILLVTIEVLIGLTEYFFQTRSFFINDFIPIEHKSDFLYDHRVYGLSINSSILSFKILGAILLLTLNTIKKLPYFALLFILYAGVFITFNRALIIALLFFNSIYFISGFIQFRTNWKQTFYMLIPLLSFLLVFSLFAKHNLWTELNKRNPENNQLTLENRKLPHVAAPTLNCSEEYLPILQSGKQLDTSVFLNRFLIRRTEQINTSGRTLIWANYIAFIHHHLWFGNGSDKLYFQEIQATSGTKKLVHAHNSFLQVVATNGILISSCFFLLLFLFWQKKHLLLITTLLFFSLFQYGIFWGFSFLDVLFIALLLSDLKTNNETN